jgi:hypothetical protein
MPRAAPLPDEFRDAAFSVADARRRGVSRSRLRASDLLAPFYGTRLATAAPTLRQRCLAWQSVAPVHSYVSHSTAALLFGCPLPWRLERAHEIHVTVERPMRPPRTRGITGHSTAPRPGSWLESRGLRMSTAEETWLGLASQLDRVELVAAGDYLLRGFRRPNGTRRPFTTLQRLRDAAARHPAAVQGIRARDEPRGLGERHPTSAQARRDRLEDHRCHALRPAAATPHRARDKRELQKRGWTGHSTWPRLHYEPEP